MPDSPAKRGVVRYDGLLAVPATAQRDVHSPRAGVRRAGSRKAGANRGKSSTATMDTDTDRDEDTQDTHDAHGTHDGQETDEIDDDETPAPDRAEKLRKHNQSELRRRAKSVFVFLCVFLLLLLCFCCFSVYFVCFNGLFLSAFIVNRFDLLIKLN